MRLFFAPSLCTIKKLFSRSPAVALRKIISLNFQFTSKVYSKKKARKKSFWMRIWKNRAPKISRSIIGKIQNSTKNYLTSTAFALRLFETKKYLFSLDCDEKKNAERGSEVVGELAGWDLDGMFGREEGICGEINMKLCWNFLNNHGETFN